MRPTLATRQDADLAIFVKEAVAKLVTMLSWLRRSNMYIRSSRSLRGSPRRMVRPAPFGDRIPFRINGCLIKQLVLRTYELKLIVLIGDVAVSNVFNTWNGIS